MKKISEFIQSAETVDQYPELPFKEIAVLGRSNAGKSSLLNILLKRNIVKVSSKPGKTRLVNFFSKEDKYVVVDLPGYGFAQISEEARKSWQKTVEDYLKNRENLVGTIIVIDSRRDWQAEEKDLTRWLSHRQLPYVIAMTKVDKLTQAEKARRKYKLQQTSHCPHVFETTIEKKTSVDALENFIYNEWILNSAEETPSDEHP